MNLHEYQVKQLIARYGLPVPVSYVCMTPHDAEKAVSKIGLGPWIMKCQIHAGGRGKAGGIKIVNNKEEIRHFFKQWLGKRLVTQQTNADGQPVNLILVESVTNIAQELYLGAIIDASAHRVVLIASAKGGIVIEKIAEKTPHLIHKVEIDPLIGPMPYQGRRLAFSMGMTGKLVKQFTKIFMGLAKIVLERDLTMIEINPLAITSQGDLICLDSKLCIDTNALFRQPDLREMRDQSQEEPREVQAEKWKLNYVALKGNIGCIVNGAGLAMSTIDTIKLYGGEPANFLDVGGGVTRERAAQAFKIVLSDKSVKVILVNIFGGIVQCDLVAAGIIGAAEELNTNIPIVVCLKGNKAELGFKNLVNSSLNIIFAESLTDAVLRSISAAKEKNVYLNQ